MFFGWRVSSHAMAVETSKSVVVRCALLLCLAISANSDNCRIGFKDYPAAHEVIEPLYLIDLSIVNTTHGLATTYFPDTQYDIIIRPKSDALSFKEFHFKMENADSSKSYGALELRDRDLTTFDTQEYCINRVINLATPNKPNVTIGWQSPPRKSGCIQMIAYVKETEIRYHNANLTVCEDPRIELDDPGQIVNNCSVCERAKYEMTFKGVWSKYTHPRSFPRRDWLAGFPTVIGATHHHDYKIWEVYKYPSEAMKKFAETGNSLDLELELKAQAFYNLTTFDNVTTIIKFRGTNFKNKTHAYAQLQVDRRNHLVSLVARINPSPDWFIGVSGLELCMGNSWMESKSLNLYAYDVGSRAGLIFEAENYGYTEDVINHMNMSWPAPPAGSKIELPFYDPHNNTHEVRPLAVVEFKRIRLFDNTCAEKPDERKLEEDCFEEWYETKPCNETCGYDTRTFKRNYKEGKSNKTCPGKTERRELCNDLVACPFVATEKDCQMTEWTSWDPCTKPCGRETIGRTRNFKESTHLSQCKAKFPEMYTHEFKDCGHPPCPNMEQTCDDTLYHSWSDWGECSVTVGQGIRYRHRELKNDTVFGDEVVPNEAGFVGCTYATEVCEGIDPKTITEAPIINRNNPETAIILSTLRPQTKPRKCLKYKDEGEACDGKEDESLYRWAYDQDSDRCELFQYKGCYGNENRFLHEKDCLKECYDGEKIDCVMQWTDWTKCDCNGVITRNRIPIVLPSPIGQPCPKSGLSESKPCSFDAEKCKELKEQ